MEKQVYVVYDCKASYYKMPFMCRNNQEALRMFGDVANKPDTEIGCHPEDYVLYHIGSYREDKGVYVNVEHTCLGKAIEYVKMSKNIEA